MPWGKDVYENTLSLYRDMLEDSYLKLRNDSELSTKELLVRINIFKHDFTKRQLNILSFIVTMSYLCGKHFAIIPKLIDFQVAGISLSKAKIELVKLEEMNVIKWDRDENIFEICDPKRWTVPFNVEYNSDRNSQLLRLNLKHTGFDMLPLIKQLTREGY